MAPSASNQRAISRVIYGPITDLTNQLILKNSDGTTILTLDASTIYNYAGFVIGWTGTIWQVLPA